MAGAPRPVRVRVVRWTKNGRRVPPGTPGARRARGWSRTWFYWTTEAGKRVRRSLKTTDEGVAWERLRALLRTADPADRPRRPLAELMKDWAAQLRAQDVTDKQVRSRLSQLRRLLALSEPPWRTPADVTADAARLALDRLRRTPGEGTGRREGVTSRSAATRNSYLAGLRAFLRWCHQGERDPLAGVRPLDEALDRRHHRRAPETDEVRRLFAHLLHAPARKGMTAAERAVVYRTAMATGFRASEVRSLTPASFRLDADPPTARVAPAYSRKRKGGATQILPPWFAEEVRPWLDCPPWHKLSRRWPGEMLKEDLEAAGIPYSVPGPDGEPLFWDFHALRHWYCTEAAANAADLKTLLALTRHGSSKLAIETYAKVKPERVRAASERIPEPGARLDSPPPTRA